MIATAPRGVFLDLDVLAAAPRRLIAAGFGDSICRSTAQTDWLLAHLLTGSPYRKAPFVLLEDDETELVASAGSLARGDQEAIRLLAHTLVMSGVPDVPVVIDPIIHLGPEMAGDAKKKIGGGAAAGAGIGWLKGGVMGALTGAAVGAGAGVGTKVVEGRKPAFLPGGATARVELRSPAIVTVKR